MKTFWRSPLDHNKARVKQGEFERTTGVKWNWFSVNGGTAFTPIATRDTPMDEAAATTLLPYLKGGLDYQGFVKLAEISGLTLAQVVSGAKTLAQTGRAVAGVNRMGNFAYIRRR